MSTVPAPPQQTAFTTVARPITERDVELFAALSGDHHPQHLDAEWAAGSIFGERIAHGMLVLSCATGLAPLDPDRIVALRRIEGVFKAPVRFGDTISVHGRLSEAKALDDRHSLATFVWRIVNQAGKTVIRAEVDVVCRDLDAQAGPLPRDPEPDSLTDSIPGVVPL